MYINIIKLHVSPQLVLHKNHLLYDRQNLVLNQDKKYNIAYDIFELKKLKKAPTYI